MTAYEIINKAFGLAGENFGDFPDKNLALIWLNISASESVAAENAIRLKNGSEKLAAHPVVKQQSDKVDMDDAICNIALPFGVASYLFNDREDNYMSAIFRNRFITALQNAAKGEEIAIQDRYGGEI